MYICSGRGRRGEENIARAHTPRVAVWRGPMATLCYWSTPLAESSKYGHPIIAPPSSAPAAVVPLAQRGSSPDPSWRRQSGFSAGSPALSSARNTRPAARGVPGRSVYAVKADVARCGRQPDGATSSPPRGLSGIKSDDVRAKSIRYMAGDGLCAPSGPGFLSQRPSAAEMEELQRGLADMHRRRLGFLRSSHGQTGPGRRRLGRQRQPVHVEAHPRAHHYGRGLPSTTQTVKLPAWKAAQEALDYVPMQQWHLSKHKLRGSGAEEQAGFTLDLARIEFSGCRVGEDQKLCLPVRNCSGGPLRLRLRHKPHSPAFSASLSFPSGAPVAAGLCAELCVHCKGDWVGKRGAEDQLVFEVEGRRELRLIVPLIAWSALPPTLSQAELQRRQAARDVAALR